MNHRMPDRSYFWPDVSQLQIWNPGDIDKTT